MNFSISVDIDAAPDVVWSLVSDIEHWPEWTPSVKSIRRLGRSGPLQPGSRALVRQPKLLPAVWTVTSMRPDRRFTWKTALQGMWVVADHWVEATANGSRATLSLQFQGLFGPLLARVTKGTNEKYLHLEANGLKRKSEAIVGVS